MTDRAMLPHGIAKNILAKAGAEVGSRFLGVLFILLAARMLGPEGFGKFTFAAALAALFSAAIEFGVRPIVIRELARAPEQAERFWRIVSGMTLVIGGLLLPLLPLTTLALHRSTETVWAVALMGAFGLISAFHELGIAFFTAMRVQEYELLVRLLTKGLLVLGAFGALGAGGGLLLMTAAYPVSALVVLPLVFWIVRRWTPRLQPSWDRGESLRLWQEAWPLAGGALFHYATWRLPPLFLALLRDDREVGYFGAAFRLVETLGFVPAIFVSAIFPILSSSYGRNDERLRLTVQKTFQLLLVLACPMAVGTIFVGRPLLDLFYGVTFEPATPVLSLLIWTSAFNFLNVLLFFVFISVNRQQEVTRITGVGLGAMFLFTPPLILWMGGVGAGLGLALLEAGMTGLSVLRLRALLPRLGLWSLAPKVLAASGMMALGLWGLGKAPLALQLPFAIILYAGSLSLLHPVSRQELSLYYREILKRKG